MDQPQENDDSVQNVNDQDLSVDQQQSPDESEQNNDSTDSADGETSDEHPQSDDARSNDSVMDGVPSSGEDVEILAEPSQEPVESTNDAVQNAEDQVAEAMPQSSADELADVANELEILATADPMALEQAENSETESVQKAPTHDSFGSDPMEQILNDEALEVEPSPMQMPEEDGASTSQDDSSAYDKALERKVEADSASDSVAVEPAQESDSPVLSNETPVEEPISGGATNDAVSMANAAELEKVEAVNPGAMISDVIAPTATAAATSVGTAGENAITGTPESSTVESAQGTVLANQKVQIAKNPKSSKLFLILIVTLVTILFGGGAVAAYMLRGDTGSDAENSSETLKVEESGEFTVSDQEDEAQIKTSAPGDKVEAKTLDDYKAACASGGLVSNATAYLGTSPHPLVVFEKGSDDKFARSLVTFKDKAWLADATKVTSGQLVTCIARKASSEVKLKVCPITDSVTKVTANVDFYSTKYTVDVYEAKTGKKVTSFENSSISTTCPTNAVYNKADPKIYAGFDLVALETSLKDVVTKTL